MLLGVQTDEAVTSKIKTLATSIKYFAEHEEILIEDLTFKDDTINFILLDSDEMTKVDTMLAEIQGLDIQKSEDLTYSIQLQPAQITLTKDLAVTQAVETIRNRLDQFGLAEPTVIRQGSEDIVVELPGIKTAAEEKAARELISKPANLELMAVDEDRADQVYTMTASQASEYGNIILEKSDGSGEKFLVKEIPK